MFRTVAGLLKPTAGTVRIAENVAFGFVPQRFSLYEDLSIDENLSLRARLYEIPDDVAAKRTKDLLQRVGLDRFGKRLAGALSGGMRQSSLVSALMTQPPLLLLDEPTTGVDPVSRREFWLLLNRLHHEGLTIVVSTPYMDEAEYATHLAFLDHGRLSALGTRDEILSSYPRLLVEVRSSKRLEVKKRLEGLKEVDDVSLFGTRLHVRGREKREKQGKDRGFLEGRLREALAGIVEAEDIRLAQPSLEDCIRALQRG